ncbi:CapA family protein [uncultured Algoriphagus sp.]|uniref:CapA family protein n=1 Tax=uncultured Algoriphagus sp. TaxID=417365 RepID=UPI0025921465|nr:CapA family protein [uncultured Algoriphagus sp.]
MSVKLNFVGDIGLFKSFEDNKIDPIKEIQLPDADFNIGNFEFIGYDSKFTKNYFDVQTKYFPSLGFLGKCNLEKFNYLSLANNHIMDFGVKGVEENIRFLQSKGINYFGFGCDNNFNTSIIYKGNVKILLIGCIGKGRWSKIYNNGCGPDELDLHKLLNFISSKKSKYNHIIVFPHWGSELVDVPNPLDIDKAHRLIDSGASAVIGTHSHIIQGVENYKNGVIAYGLGSFIYSPKEEFGYIKNKKRDYSICFNISLNGNSIVDYKSHYYLLDTKNIPRRIINPSIKEIKYFDKLNKMLGDEYLYKRKKYSSLLIREIYSMFLRLIKNPKAGFNHYYKYFFSKY